MFGKGKLLPLFVIYNLKIIKISEKNLRIVPDDSQCRASLNELQSRSNYYTESLINSHSMRRWETNSNKIKIVVRKTFSPPACYSNDNVVTQKGKKPKCESRVFKQRIRMHLDIVIFYK